MKSIISSVLAFIFLGTYNNYVDRPLISYTAEPLVAVSKGQATYSPLEGVIIARESNSVVASRSRAQFNDPKSELAIKSYQHYLKESIPAKELSCYFKLVDRESKWNPIAQNPKSTAFGIGQFLNSTWGLVDSKKTSDPYVQIDAMIKYVNLIYGDGCKALDFRLYKGWY
jgi:hypothetical protein